MKCLAYIQEGRKGHCGLFDTDCSYEGIPSFAYCETHKISLLDVSKAVENGKNLRAYLLTLEGKTLEKVRGDLQI